MSESNSQRYQTELLKQAEELIHGDRVQKYGPAVESFDKVAQVASILTGKQLSAEDCLLMQVAQKLVRSTYSPENPDHLRDIMGYLGMLDEVRDSRKQARKEPLKQKRILLRDFQRLTKYAFPASFAQEQLAKANLTQELLDSVGFDPYTWVAAVLGYKRDHVKDALFRAAYSSEVNR